MNLINKIFFKERKIPIVIYYWHLERLLTTFPLIHFYMFYDYVYYSLPLHIILYIFFYKTLKIVFTQDYQLETKYDWGLLHMYSFSFSLLALIFILMIWVVLQCIIIPTIYFYL